LNKLFYITLLLVIYGSDLSGQEKDRERYVQLSGFITDVSDRPVQGVTIISKKLRKGTVSERSGIYSITSMPGDTVFFRALGYKRYHTIIPETYEDRYCSVDIILETDTIQIEAVNILPWRSYNEFIKDITKEHPVDPIIENMNDNLASIYVAIANQTGVRITAATGYRYAMEQNFSALATKNQMPVNNLLNPFAWGKFFQGVKNGMFKNQKFNKPVKPIKPKVKKKSKKSSSDK
jgi:hypothetical protein